MTIRVFSSLKTSVAAAVVLHLLAVSGISQVCSKGCLVNISGLKPLYSSSSKANVDIHNASSRVLDINVAIEGLDNSGSWKEVVGSVSDPAHSLSKIVKLRRLNPGEAIAVSYSPCRTAMIFEVGGVLKTSSHPCSDLSANQSLARILRLRVDVYDHMQRKLVQQVVSQEYRIVGGK